MENMTPCFLNDIKFSLFLLSLLLIFMISPSYAQESFAVEGVIYSRPLVNNNVLILGTDEYLYAYDLKLDKLIWSININVDKLFISNGYVIVSGDGGVTVIDANGNPIKTFAKSEVNTYQDLIYLMRNDRIYVYGTKNDFVEIRNFSLSDYGLSDCDKLIISDGELLVRCDNTLFNTLTRTSTDVSGCGKLFSVKGRVICYDNYDITLYSANLSIIKSKYVNGKIIDYGYFDNRIFFTLSDNSILLMDINGNTIWKTSIPLVTQAIHIDDYFIVGSKKDKLYYLDKNGILTFEYPVDDWVDYIISDGSKLIYVTHDNVVHINDYGYLCYIKEPISHSIVGSAPLHIKAIAFLKKDRMPSLSLDNNIIHYSINRTGNQTYVYALDAITSMYNLSLGEHQIACLLNNDTLYSVKFFKSDKVLRDLKVRYSPESAEQNEPIHVYGYDEKGFQVPISIEGFGSGYDVVVRFEHSGSNVITVKSNGYYNTTVTIQVKKAPDNMKYMYYIIGIIIVFIIAYILNKRNLRRTKIKYEI